MIENIVERDKEYILNVYKRLPLEVEKASGSYLIDVSGEKYLDFTSGISVNNFGYDQELVDVMINQMSKYMHISNSFVSTPVVDLANKLVDNTFANKVFYTNSGTEAIEAALKLVKKYGNINNKSEILSAYNSFHGRTIGSLSITGQEKYQKSFRPLLDSVNHFEYNNIESFKNCISKNTLAVFLELVQGEGGVIPLDKKFLEEMLKLRAEYGFLIVIDEAQTGLGRCGKLFAYQQYDFEPDIITVAKFIGGGLPLGAVLLNEKLENIFTFGDHGSTFGGNPVACAGGNYILEKLTEIEFIEELKLGEIYLWERIRVLQEKYPTIIKEVRGLGMMIGMECGGYALEIKEKALEEGLILNVTSQTVIRLLPNLKISKAEIDEFEKLISLSIDKVIKNIL